MHQAPAAAPPDDRAPGGGLVERLGVVAHRAAPVVVLALFAVAIWAIHRELAAHSLRDLAAEVRRVSPAWIALALGLTAAAYLTLTLYDTLALRYLGKRVPYGHTALTSFAAYALSHSIGFAALSGGAVRYRLYGVWGLSAVDVGYVLAFNAVTLFLGAAAILAAACAFQPDDLAALVPLPPAAFVAVAALLIGLVVAYLCLCAARREAVTVRGWRFALPSAPMAAAQIGLAMVDWTLAAGVLYVLIPAEIGLGFTGFVGLFTLAALSGLASHVPGGIGVFEAVILALTGDAASPTAMAAGLILYRLVYYVVPLVVAALLFAGHELAEHRHLGRRVGRAFGRVSLAIAPNVFAVLLFMAGVVLLASGATPADPERLRLLRYAVPLGVIEVSHFLGGIVGLLLLLVAWGLRRRLDGAWLATVAALVAGIALSLLRGLDYEEASLLGVMLLAILPCRDAFYRRTALTAEWLSPGWLAAVVAVVAGTAWLGFLSYQNVAYRDELWWRFVLFGDAPRFLRATAGVVVVLLLVGAAQLLRAARGRDVAGDAAAVERARVVIAAAEGITSSAFLALLGDKRFLFSDSGRSFVMYGVQGRSWIAMGEPVGRRAERAELLWGFRTLCDRFGGRPAFYQVSAESLPEFVELGLGFYKLGEQALVPLAGFSLEGGAGRSRRNLVHRLRRAGCAFEVLSAEAVPTVMGGLRAVSDAWLAAAGARERGFSLGRFDPAYLVNFPVAVVRRRGEIVAFASLWATPDRRELSTDLVRFGPDAPRSVMRYLFLELMLWGRERGYALFDLGMAPMSGLVDRRLATLWTRAGALLFRHGEHFHDFQGLRRYKEKFDPLWEPRYLAAPGGFALPRVLTDLTLLIGGGVSGVLGRERVRDVGRGAAGARPATVADPP